MNLKPKLQVLKSLTTHAFQIMSLRTTVCIQLAAVYTRVALLCCLILRDSYTSTPVPFVLQISSLDLDTA